MHRFSKNAMVYPSYRRLVTVPLYAFALASEPIDGSPLEKQGKLQVAEDTHKPHYLYFTVQGNSMDNGSDTAILDGDILVADTSDLQARQGQVYLWDIPGLGPCIKLLGQHPTLGACLISLNPEHRPFIPLDGARPIGRVVGKIRGNRLVYLR